MGLTGLPGDTGPQGPFCLPNPSTLGEHGVPGLPDSRVIPGSQNGGGKTSCRSQHNAPCAICHVQVKFSVIVIPAKYTCPSGWTREYYGYLMSESINYSRSTYKCAYRIFPRKSES